MCGGGGEGIASSVDGVVSLRLSDTIVVITGALVMFYFGLGDCTYNLAFIMVAFSTDLVH